MLKDFELAVPELNYTSLKPTNCLFPGLWLIHIIPHSRRIYYVHVVAIIVEFP